MKKYEYDVWIGKPMDKTLFEFLNRKGQEGWQLVYHDDGLTFIFMREIVTS